MGQHAKQLATVIKNYHYHAYRINVLVNHINIGVEALVSVKKQMALLVQTTTNVIKV